MSNSIYPNLNQTGRRCSASSAANPLRLRAQRTSTDEAAEKKRPESRGRSKQHRKKRLLLLSQSSPTTSSTAISSSLADAYSIYARGAPGLDGAATFSSTSSFFGDRRVRPRTADETSTPAPSATMIFLTTRSPSPPPRAASATGVRFATQSYRVVAHRQEWSTSVRRGNQTNGAHPASLSNDPAALKRVAKLGACNGLNSSRRVRGESISATFRSPGWQRSKTEPQCVSVPAQGDPSGRFPEPGSARGRPLSQHSVAGIKAGDRRGARRRRTRKATRRKKEDAGLCPEGSILSPERAAARMANLRKVYGEHSVNLWRARRSAS